MSWLIRVDPETGISLSREELGNSEPEAAVGEGEGIPRGVIAPNERSPGNGDIQCYECSERNGRLQTPAHCGQIWNFFLDQVS